MKQLPAFLVIGLIISFFVVVPPAAADLLTFEDVNDREERINHFGPGVDEEFMLGFPDAPAGEPYPTYGGDDSWEYDAYYLSGDVEELTITLTGSDVTPDDEIDIFFSFDDFDTSTRVAAVNPLDYGSEDDYENFTMELDIISQQWTLTDINANTEMGSLIPEAIGLGDFVGYDSFWVGYGCHFTHLSTGVFVSAQDQFVPEPATLSLFGLGLIGLGVFRKKRR